MTLLRSKPASRAAAFGDARSAVVRAAIKRALVLPLAGLVLAALLVAPVVVSDVQPVAAQPQTALRLIINASNPAQQLEHEFVVDAFLKKTTRWPDGEVIHPVDQRIDAAVRLRFCASVLKRSLAAVRHYWQQRIFSGRGVPPPELESDAAVVARVQKDRGAIGYVSERADISGVKVISMRAK